MSERITQQQGSDIAGIALSIPTNATSGELLAALHKAWKKGYDGGRAVGFVEGQREMARVQEMVLGSLAPTVNP